MYKPCIIKKARQIYINGYELEDLIQIGALALIKAAKKYQLGRKVAFTTYAVTVIRNSFNEELRKVLSKKLDENFKCSLNSLNKDGIEFIEVLVSDENVEADAISREQISVLAKALEKLSEDEREIIQWFYFENKPLKEYAKAKGIALNTAAKRKQRAIEKLKNYFFSYKIS
jgi:RNA polymerase sigma factor, sigma-70 family